MKKLKTNDLTPEILKEVMKFDTPQEVTAYFKEKDFYLSEKGAQKILDYLKEEVHELSDDELDKVSGGCSGGSTGS